MWLLSIILTASLNKGIYDSYIDIQSEINQSRIETEDKLNMETRVTCFDDFINSLSQDKQEIFTEEFTETLLYKCNETNISPWLVLSIVKNESGFNPKARAYDGSSHYGLMQLSERYFGDEIALTKSQDIFEPVANITVGIDNLHNIQEKIKYYSCLKDTNIEYPLESLTVLSHNKGLGDAVPLFQSGSTNRFTQNVINDYKKFLKEYGEIDCAKELGISHLGYWIPFNDRFVCSDCNEMVEVVEINGIPIYKYCPYCGKEKNLDYKLPSDS